MALKSLLYKDEHKSDNSIGSDNNFNQNKLPMNPQRQLTLILFKMRNFY